MIEAVSTLSVQNTSLKAQSQQSVSASVAAVEAAAAPAAAAAHQDFVVSRIRVDNLRDVAFLEYVSSDSGKVLRQYPNEKQISAYERASESFQPEDRAAPKTSAPQTVIVDTSKQPAAGETSGVQGTASVIA